MSTIGKSMATTISMIVLSLSIVSPIIASAKENKRIPNSAKVQQVHNPSGSGLRLSSSSRRNPKFGVPIRSTVTMLDYEGSPVVSLGAGKDRGWFRK